MVRVILNCCVFVGSNYHSMDITLCSIDSDLQVATPFDTKGGSDGGLLLVTMSRL